MSRCTGIPPIILPFSNGGFDPGKSRNNTQIDNLQRKNLPW